MDESQVKKLVDENIKSLMLALQLQNWDISIYIEQIEGNIPARNQPEIKYRNAKIQINPLEEEYSKQVLDDLRHELLHCFHSSFETYRKAVGQLITDITFEAIDEIFKRACEETVLAIEDMLNKGLGLTAEKMIEIAIGRKGLE